MTPQKPSNALNDPELRRRFSRLIVTHMVRLGLSDDELLARLKRHNLMRGSLSSIRRHKDGTGGQPTAQTINLYQRALGISDGEIETLLYPDPTALVGPPGVRELRDQSRELGAELKGQSNLPYPVHRDRAAAEARVPDSATMVLPDTPEQRIQDNEGRGLRKAQLYFRRESKYRGQAGAPAQCIISGQSPAVWFDLRGNHPCNEDSTAFIPLSPEFADRLEQIRRDITSRRLLIGREPPDVRLNVDFPS